MGYVITGGAGYIGGHLVDRLVGANEVMAIDDLSKGSYVNKASNFVKADLRTDELDLPSGSQIVHLAADPDIKDSMSNVTEHFSRDVIATHRILEAARKADAEMFLFASTSAVYGNAKIMPTPETAPLAPVSNYALFKKMSEDMVEYYCRNYGIKSAALRFANVVGGRTGHGILYNFTQRIKQNLPLEIWGDGKQSKNYIYIDDLLSAIETAASKLGSDFAALNVGSSGTTSVDEIVRLFREQMKMEYGTVRIEAQAGDVRSMLLDTSKIKSLGWEPKLDSGEAARKAIEDILEANGIGSS